MYYEEGTYLTYHIERKKYAFKANALKAYFILFYLDLFVLLTNEIVGAEIEEYVVENKICNRQGNSGFSKI